MTDCLDMTKAARERRQTAWQMGHDHAARLDQAGHFAPPEEGDEHLRYLFFLGVSNYFTAKARDIGRIDERRAAAVNLLEGS